MKKMYLIVFVLLWISSYSQSFDHQFHSELIDMKLSRVKHDLLKDGIIDSSMVLIPIFDIEMVSKPLLLDTLTKDYLKSLRFLKDNDSISAHYGKDCFYLSELLVYKHNTKEVYRVDGFRRFPSPKSGLSIQSNYRISELYNKQLYYFISMLYINTCIDYIFVYPTHWGSEKVIVDGIFFAIKNNEVFIITDNEGCSGLFILEDFVDNNWNTLIGMP